MISKKYDSDDSNGDQVSYSNSDNNDKVHDIRDVMLVIV
jgi:hypothetical protein